MNVFVTGATGVIGRRVVPALVGRGDRVTAVGRSESRMALLWRWGAEPIVLDLYDREAVVRALRGQQAVCNLATAVPATPVRSFLPGAWRETDRIRREVSANLVHAALRSDRVERLIQESFAPIYADGGDQWIDETSTVRPSRYNRSALAAEAAAERLTAEGRTGVVLRFGLLYGREDAATELMVDAVRRGWSPFVGRPEGYMSWLRHEDAATAVVAALEVPAGVYNVVEDEPRRRHDLAAGIARLLGVAPPRFLPPWVARLGGSVGEMLSRSLRISNRRLREAGAWAPAYRGTVEGLRDVLRARAERGRPAKVV
jgi:nucleoside-diphosphate-sugar epimerase